MLNSLSRAFSAKLYHSRGDQLTQATKAGAARELFEETGMDVRKNLNRLVPVVLHGDKKSGKLPNELKSRLFYTLNVSDDDFPSTGVTPMSQEGSSLKVSEFEM